jgi:hypothetical protein
MGRTSGPFPLGTNNTWAGLQTFGNQVTFNQGVALNTVFSMAATVHAAAATLVGGSPVHLFDTTAGAFALTLPAAPAGGQVYYIKQINSANALTVAGNGKNIDGAASIVFTAQNEGVLVQYNAALAAWFVIAKVAATIL